MNGVNIDPRGRSGHRIRRFSRPPIPDFRVMTGESVYREVFSRRHLPLPSFLNSPPHPIFPFCLVIILRPRALNAPGDCTEAAQGTSESLRGLEKARALIAQVFCGRSRDRTN